MTLNEIRNIINIISGEKLKGRVITPEDFELMLKVANLKHFKRKVGLPEEYQPGAPLPAQAFEITTKSTMDLSPFKVHMGRTGVMPLYVDTYGEAVTPSDMYYPSTMQYNYILNGVTKKRNIDIVSDLEWTERSSDALTQPTDRNPVANIQDSYIRFSPITDKFVEFVYLRYPIDPVYAYSQDKGYVEYNASSSTELEWDEVNQIDIISILLFDLGINMGKGDILSYADKVKKEGV